MNPRVLLRQHLTWQKLQLNIFDFKHLILTSWRIVSSSQLGNGLGLCVHLCSYFVLWSNYLSPPHRFSAWPIELHLFLLLPSCKQETGKSLILEQMLQSVPYPVTPKAMQVCFPHCCIIGNLLNAFLPKSFLKVLISYEYIPTWHVFFVCLWSFPVQLKYKIQKEKAR